MKLALCLFGFVALALTACGAAPDGTVYDPAAADAPDAQAATPPTESAPAVGEVDTELPSGGGHGGGLGETCGGGTLSCGGTICCGSPFKCCSEGGSYFCSYTICNATPAPNE